jgi:hypothetical protein
MRVGQRRLRDRVSFLGLAAGLTILGAAACTAASDANPPATPVADVKSDTAPPPVAVAKAPPKRVPVAAKPAAPAPARTEPAPAAAQPAAPVADSSPPLLAARSRRDSIAYASTIESGRAMLAKWPVLPEPLEGSILPSRRIVAFYGNPLVKRMGVLGEYPRDQMLAKLDSVVREWEVADPATPVQPALQLIAVTAQRDPGRDSMYRLRMDTALIEKVYGWARQKHALLFLDVQVGHSTMEQELPPLMPFLSRPDVHLAIDPEFWMHHRREGVVPGVRFGQMDANDINWVTDQLRQLVVEQNLPPKILVIHRFRTDMLRNSAQILLDAHVQIVMNMDGFGPPWQKFESYRDYIDAEPVEYTGFKVFFHNDAQGRRPLLTPQEIMGLRPIPLYIQYQ